MDDETTETHEHEWYEGAYTTTDDGIFVLEHCACGATRAGRKMSD